MKLVLANGVFDLLHVAHLRHLERARMYGDMLVVGLTTDESATREKRKPIIPQDERRELLLGLHCVSAVTFCRDSIEALETWKPAVFVKGFDYGKKGLLPAEIEFCGKHGIEIFHTEFNPQTTSNIIERIKNG